MQACFAKVKANVALLVHLKYMETIWTLQNKSETYWYSSGVFFASNLHVEPSDDRSYPKVLTFYNLGGVILPAPFGENTFSTNAPKTKLWPQCRLIHSINRINTFEIMETICIMPTSGLLNPRVSTSGRYSIVLQMRITFFSIYGVGTWLSNHCLPIQTIALSVSATKQLEMSGFVRIVWQPIVCQSNQLQHRCSYLQSNWKYPRGTGAS